MLVFKLFTSIFFIAFLIKFSTRCIQHFFQFVNFFFFIHVKMRKLMLNLIDFIIKFFYWSRKAFRKNIYYTFCLLLITLYTDVKFSIKFCIFYEKLIFIYFFFFFIYHHETFYICTYALELLPVKFSCKLIHNFIITSKKQYSSLKIFLSTIKTKVAIKFPFFFSTENWLGTERVNFPQVPHTTINKVSKYY